MIKYILLLSICLVVFSCTGEESLGVDSTPPEPPELIPHLGDTGDIILGDTLNYYDTNDNELENNGIDAVSGGDWMQIQWHHLVDSDIDYLEIYRFSALDYYNDTIYIGINLYFHSL